jgi:iron complex outermembrane receptor protein
MNLYATVSKGYHAGGFNSINAPSPTYNSEFVWNYEVGFKGAFWANRVQTQLDAFYLDWTGQQINLSVQSSGVSQSFIANAGRSRIAGEEAAVQWAVSQSFNLDGSLTFLDAKYKSYQDTIIAPQLGLNPDLDGKTLPFAPRVTGSLSGQYVAALPLGGGGWKMRLRADVRYSSARYFDPTDLLRANAYWLTNVYAGIQDRHYEIGVYANNVFDKGYLTGGFLPQGYVFPPEVVLGEPRIVGIRFNALF